MKKNTRYIVMVVLLAAIAVVSIYFTSGRAMKAAPARKSFAEFPERAGGWRAIDAQALGQRQAQELNADDYLSRAYANDRGTLAYFFAAWYGGQGHRRTIHSPQNCIPGAGWTMGKHKVHSLAVIPSTGAEINEYLIEKDGNRMLAFYWYQGRGRVSAGDYKSRLLLLYDGLTAGRNDGALVRVIVPIAGGPEAEFRARSAGLNFARIMIPALNDFIP